MKRYMFVLFVIAFASSANAQPPSGSFKMATPRPNSEAVIGTAFSNPAVYNVPAGGQTVQQILDNLSQKYNFRWEVRPDNNSNLNLIISGPATIRRSNLAQMINNLCEAVSCDAEMNGNTLTIGPPFTGGMPIASAATAPVVSTAPKPVYQAPTFANPQPMPTMVMEAPMVNPIDPQSNCPVAVYPCIGLSGIQRRMLMMGARIPGDEPIRSGPLAGWGGRGGYYGLPTSSYGYGYGSYNATYSYNPYAWAREGRKFAVEGEYGAFKINNRIGREIEDVVICVNGKFKGEASNHDGLLQGDPPVSLPQGTHEVEFRNLTSKRAFKFPFEMDSKAITASFGMNYEKVTVDENRFADESGGYPIRGTCGK